MAHHGRRRLCRWVNGWRDRRCGLKRCAAREDRLETRCELGEAGLHCLHLVLLHLEDVLLSLHHVHALHVFGLELHEVLVPRTFT